MLSLLLWFPIPVVPGPTCSLCLGWGEGVPWGAWRARLLLSLLRLPLPDPAPKWAAGGGGLLAGLEGWWVVGLRHLSARVLFPELVGLSKLVPVPFSFACSC